MPRPIGEAVVLSDLDGTIAFKPVPTEMGFVPRDALVVVQERHGRLIAAMTRRTARVWRRIAATGRGVIVTTRTLEQYHDVRLPGPPPRLVFAANGGLLLVDGQVDEAWSRRVRRHLARGSASLRMVLRDVVPALAVQPGVDRVRNADGLFVLARAENGLTGEFAAELRERLAAVGWRLELQGRGVYLLPDGLDKSAACREAAARLDAGIVVAGGDSWLDARMLTSADLGIRPAHGQLHEAGWAPGGIAVTEASGARAGEQIVDWYAAHLLGAGDP